MNKLRWNFNWNSYIFIKKMRLKMLYAKWQPFVLASLCSTRVFNTMIGLLMTKFWYGGLLLTYLLFVSETTPESAENECEVSAWWLYKLLVRDIMCCFQTFVFYSFFIVWSHGLSIFIWIDFFLEIMSLHIVQFDEDYIKRNILQYCMSISHEMS